MPDTLPAPTYRKGDIVRTQDGREYEVGGYDGDALRFARMGGMRRHESMVALVYRPVSRAEVEALRAALLQACDTMQVIHDDESCQVDDWRKLATEGLPE